MRLVLRRILMAVPTLLVMSFLVFIMLELAPGNVTTALFDDNTSQAAKDELLEELGYDQPLIVRYMTYVTDLLRGDMGVSARTGRAVSDELALRLPYTLTLTGGAIALGILVGVMLGTVAALYHNRWPDHIVQGLISMGMATPAFWIALLLVWVFALQLNWFPVFGVGTPKHFILPAVSASLSLMPGIARMTRMSLLETQEQQYVLVARSKGLAQWWLLWRHIRPVAAVPVVTYIGLQAVNLISSIVTIETIFNYPGLGGLAVQAALDRDPLMLQGVTLLIAALTFGVLLVVDLTVMALDPRIRQAV